MGKVRAQGGVVTWPYSHSESVAKVGPDGRSPDQDCCVFFHYSCVDLHYWLVREMNAQWLNNLPMPGRKLLAEPDEFIPYGAPSA